MALYVKTAGGNSNAAATWSNVSSAGVDNSGPPTSADDCFAELGSGQLTVNAALSCKSFSATGGTGDYAGTLTHNTGITWTIAGSLTFSSGMTYTPGASSTITISANGTLTSAGKLLPTVNSTAGTLTLGDDLNFAALKNNTLTLSNSNFNMNAHGIFGNSTVNRVYVRGATLGTQVSIVNMTTSFSNADFRDIAPASGSVDLSAITGGSGNSGGNSENITFTSPTTQDLTLAGNDNFSSVGIWSSRIPLPQDSWTTIAWTSGTLTLDEPRIGKNIDTSGASGRTLTLGVNVSNFGSLNLSGVSTFSGAFAWTFESQTRDGISTLKSNGRNFPGGVTLNSPGATLQLQDAFSSTVNLVTFTNGIFDNATGNYSFTAITCARATGICEIRMGTGTTWTITTSSANSGWDLSGAGTNTTIIPGTSTIVYSSAGTNTKRFAGASRTYYNLSLPSGSGGTTLFSNNDAFNKISLISGGVLKITSAQTITIADGSGFGNGTNVVTLSSTTGGSASTFKLPTGMFEGDYLSIQDSTAVGTFYAGNHSVNVSGNTGWIFSNSNPNTSSSAINRGAVAWLDALDGGDGTFTGRLTKTSYTAANMTRGANIKSGTAMVFNGTNGKITMGNIGSIYSISFWISTDTDTEEWIDLNGTQAVQISSGTIAATSWTSPTIYVNGVVTSTLAASTWSLVTVTSATSVSASAVVLGSIGAGFGAFSMTGLRLYARQLTATEIGHIYNRDRN